MTDPVSADTVEQRDQGGGALAKELAEDFIALSETYDLDGKYDTDGCDDDFGPGNGDLCRGLCEEIGCMRMKIALANRIIKLANPDDQQPETRV